MRKIFKSIMLVAAAAMAFASCQKQEILAPETFSTTITVGADVEQTKTYLGEGNWVYWGKGEALTLYVGAGETAKFFDSTPTDANDGKTEASFTVNIEDVATADSYALGGIYPASAVQGINNNDNPKSYKVALPATQNAEPGKYDPSAYIMVLKPETVEALPTEYKASFRRAVALNKITLKNVKEDISTIEITVPNTKYLAGRRSFDLTTGESGEVYENGGRTNTIKVNSAYPAGEIYVWFTSWGVELAAGQELTVKMISPSTIYTRTITAKDGGIKFVEGFLNTLTIDMTDATEEVNTDLSGDYLIAAVPKSWNLMSGTNGGKYYSHVVTGVTTSATDVKCSDFYVLSGINDCVWTVAKMGDNYSIKNKTTGKYVSYTGSANEAYTSDDAVEFALSENDGVMTVESKAVAGRKLKYNSSSPRFAFYTTDQTPLYFIPWVADTTPRIFVTSEHEQSIGADGGEVKLEYTLKNLPDQSLTVEETSDFVSASVAAGVVTVTVDANEDTESRNATLTLKCGEAASVSVTIIQAGKPAEGGDVTIETWSWAGGGKTAFGNDSNVYKTNGLGSDYANSNAPYLIKLDGTGDYFIVKVDGAIQSVSVDVKMLGGATTSYLDVQGSADGTTFTSVQKHTISGSQNDVLKLATTSSFDTSYRYVKFYFTKGSNVGVGPMSITYVSGNNAGGETPEPEEPETPVEPEQPTLSPRNLTFSATTATATVGQTFTAPTLNGVITGVNYSSSNTAVAKVDASTGAITLVGAGTTTITASAPATDQYEAGEAKYTLTVSAAETGSKKTYTLTINTSDFNGTSYAANNNEKTSKATASDGTTMDVKWTSNQVMLQSSVMQWQKSKAYIYNSTDLGSIKDITITSTAGTFTKYIGTSQQPTTAGSGGYFQIKIGSVLGKTSEVVITFEK